MYEQHAEGLAGACAVVAHIKDDQLDVGSAGDCVAVVGRRKVNLRNEVKV